MLNEVESENRRYQKMRETIGIIGAMDEEVALLLAGIKNLETVKQTGIT